jgi:hypothetical protein
VRLIITDFSTREASAIAEGSIPWKGAGRAVLRVISKKEIAASEATADRPSVVAIGFSVDPLKKPQRARYARQKRDNESWLTS